MASYSTKEEDTLHARVQAKEERAWDRNKEGNSPRHRTVRYLHGTFVYTAYYEHLQALIHTERAEGSVDRVEHPEYIHRKKSAFGTWAEWGCPSSNVYQRIPTCRYQDSKMRQGLALISSKHYCKRRSKCNWLTNTFRRIESFGYVE